MTNRSGRLSRRRAIEAALAVPLSWAGFAAHAQDKPPLRLLVGFPPGGNVDYAARLLAERLRAPLGRSVIVENKPGAGSRIALAEIKRSAADGSTLIVSVDAAFTIYPHTVAKLEYDAQKDFTPIVRIATYDYAIAVAASHPAANIREFMAWAERHPKEASYASPGSGSGPSFVGQELARIFKVPLTDVPYRGGQAANTDLVGGTIAAAVGVLPDMLELHRSGKLRVLAVGGSRRNALVPEVPTLREQGVDFEGDITIGVYAPRGLPPAQTLALGRTISEQLAGADMKSALDRQGLTPAPLSGEQLAVLHAAELRKWDALIRATGYVPQ
ncbi:tripartite tricarboxylate transporter substrate-binding protein [Aquabacterium sp.]|uniref:tripartite tricarboxylate transporter substrate-binding protein n=1 Tax=Aquabacterium sp. TaxID=1872578 RepID=UPI002BB140E5|nr:tripartite tricarboxylate transporter substrate-binding protein [Aquabacterium sp.]HSW05197.1 tripartite tricarboxylate transporter substrate-binding protein [Aquabacterium sp.]